MRAVWHILNETLFHFALSVPISFRSRIPPCPQSSAVARNCNDQRIRGEIVIRLDNARPHNICNSHTSCSKHPHTSHPTTPRTKAIKQARACIQHAGTHMLHAVHAAALAHAHMQHTNTCACSMQAQCQQHACAHVVCMHACNQVRARLQPCADRGYPHGFK